MSKFLLRRGYRYRDTQRHWGVRHMKWLRPLSFEQSAGQAIFDHYLLTIDHLGDCGSSMPTSNTSAETNPIASRSPGCVASAASIP